MSQVTKRNVLWGEWQLRCRKASFSGPQQGAVFLRPDCVILGLKWIKIDRRSHCSLLGTTGDPNASFCFSLEFLLWFFCKPLGHSCHQVLGEFNTEQKLSRNITSISLTFSWYFITPMDACLKYLCWSFLSNNYAYLRWRILYFKMMCDDWYSKKLWSFSYCSEYILPLAMITPYWLTQHAKPSSKCFTFIN
jgi:hypothetical protein